MWSLVQISGESPSAREVDFAVQAAVGADPDFFSLLGRFCPDLDARLRALTLDNHSDLNASWLCLEQDQPVGLLAAHPLREVQPRQLVAMRHYLGGVTEPMALRQALAEFQRQKAALAASDALYLTRLFVAPSHRGRGVGDCLLAHLRQLQKDRGHAACALHVRDNNAGAIALYRKHGFDWIPGHAAAGYRAMVTH